ncbi:hypothetical protein UY3_05094 [Chelonia mydas]|uniref:Uncharacterized protein n=1 Tax=Chelonia mydas TaxID=8469 RepID=M7BQ49_CHEMY|nr:hypothetical protein UY3_05094 [Chelonia mydas]
MGLVCGQENPGERTVRCPTREHQPSGNLSLQRKVRRCRRARRWLRAGESPWILPRAGSRFALRPQAERDVCALQGWARSQGHVPLTSWQTTSKCFLNGSMMLCGLRSPCIRSL